MKKIALTLFSLLAFTLPSCGGNGNSKYLDRPEDTNLEFWITQKVSSEDLKANGCTYLPGWEGANEYLDSRYQPVKGEGNMSTAPDVAVTYLLTGYPDILDDQTVTTIQITDPEIVVYGLTMSSTNQEIEKRMNQLNASKGNEGCYTLKKAAFYFSSNRITISVPVTNKRHVEF